MDDTLVLGLNIRKRKTITFREVLWALVFASDIIFGIIIIASSFGHGELLLRLLVL